MTAITPAYAHAYQTTCLQDACQLSWKNCRLPKPKARFPYLPNARSTTRDRGNDFRRWAFYTNGGFRVVDGETLDGWGVISRSLHGRIDVMFGPAVTTEAHLAFSGARAHANNTAEMTALIEAFSFLGPHGTVARDEQSCFFHDSKHAAGVCLGTIQARAHVQLALACQQSMICANTGFGSPCSTCTVTKGIWVMNVLTMPLHLGHSDLLLATTLPPSGFVITLTHPCVLMAVTTSARFCNDCSTSERMQCRYLKMGVGVVFTIGVIVFLVHFTCIFVSSVFVLSAFFSRASTLFFRTSNGKHHFVCLYCVEFW